MVEDGAGPGVHVCESRVWSRVWSRHGRCEVGRPCLPSFVWKEELVRWEGTGLVREAVWGLAGTRCRLQHVTEPGTQPPVRDGEDREEGEGRGDVVQHILVLHPG